jgi:hypothetical protein
MHIDVRDPGTGHVGWIDASGPGESPRYVAVWPLPAVPTEKSVAADDALAKLDKELQQLPVDEHPAEVRKDAAKETPTADLSSVPSEDPALAAKATAPVAKMPTGEIQLLKPLEPTTEKN